MGRKSDIVIFMTTARRTNYDVLLNTLRAIRAGKDLERAKEAAEIEMEISELVRSHESKARRRRKSTPTPEAGK